MKLGKKYDTKVDAHLWIEIGALLHEGTDSEPKAITQTKLVAYEARFANGTARMRIAPFVRRKSTHEEHGERDASVGHQNVQPDVQCQRFHERKQPRRGLTRYLHANNHYSTASDSLKV